jgi:hypothetical protein
VWPADPGGQPTSVYFQDTKHTPSRNLKDGHQQIRVNYDINIHKEVYQPSECELLLRKQTRDKKTLVGAKAKKAELEAKSTRTADEEAWLKDLAEWNTIPRLEKSIAKTDRYMKEQHCAPAAAGKG